ncbi:MAG: hypothetical protein IKC72_07460 [Clostridia bacterium]|nr:hypothetical protein [Clostridia bacterium]
MGKNARDKRPALKPVKKIELSEKNTTSRFVLLIVLLVIAAVSFTIFLFSLLNKDNGWNTISPSTNENVYTSEISLNYLLGSGETNATAEHKAIQKIYTEKLEEAYRALSMYQEFDGVVNLKTLSRSFNSEFTVSPLLFHTLRTMTENDNRILYYAPVFSLYSNVFDSTDDVIAKSQDPNYNYELLSDINKLLPYVMSQEHVRIDFLDDEKYIIRLFVSEEYQGVLTDLYIEDVISLGIFEMAFVVDHVADALGAAGYTNGTITSYNGYTRSLGTQGQILSSNIYEATEDRSVKTIARYSYSGSLSMVSFRNYPVTELDSLNFYVYDDGNMVSPYINLYTGLNQTLALNDMVFYSKTTSCAKLALTTYAYFANASLMGNDINSLTSLGIYSLYAIDGTIFYNEASLISDSNLKVLVPGYQKSYAKN